MNKLDYKLNEIERYDIVVVKVGKSEIIKRYNQRKKQNKRGAVFMNSIWFAIIDFIMSNISNLLIYQLYYEFFPIKTYLYYLQSLAYICSLIQNCPMPCAG